MFIRRRDYEAERQAWEEREQELQRRVRTLEGRAARAEGNVEQAEAAYRNLADEYDGIWKNEQELMEALEAVRKSLFEESERNHELEGKQTAAEELLESQGQHIRELSARVEELKLENTNARALMKALHRQLDSAESELDRQREEREWDETLRRIQAVDIDRLTQQARQAEDLLQSTRDTDAMLWIENGNMGETIRQALAEAQQTKDANEKLWQENAILRRLCAKAGMSREAMEACL